jgi:hypothetical protein
MQVGLLQLLQSGVSTRLRRLFAHSAISSKFHRPARRDERGQSQQGLLWERATLHLVGRESLDESYLFVF